MDTQCRKSSTNDADRATRPAGPMPKIPGPPTLNISNDGMVYAGGSYAIGIHVPTMQGSS